jgi:gliding motility-associated-like protein
MPFTPNGDGRNDIFRIPASARLKIKSFSVFNRWGQMIFKTSDSGAGWDGSFHNRSQPTGSYVWMIEYENPLTKLREMKKGVVMLIR